jgi:hypothetical protein
LKGRRAEGLSLEQLAYFHAVRQQTLDPDMCITTLNIGQLKYLQVDFHQVTVTRLSD